jgi:hypothetical protein
MRFVRMLFPQRRFVGALWILVAYLLILYVAIKWGHPTAERFPGSD